VADGGLPDSGLIAQRLALLNARVCATPRYLARAGEPRTPQALSQHECLCFPKADTWTLERDGQVIEVPVTGRYTLNSVGMIRRLALLDQGLMLLPKAVVADDLASGQVVEVLPGWQGSPVSVYALTETRLLPAKTQRLIEFLKERLATAD
jgi:DNA-binding transcriptional LysR family regulator